MCRKLLQRHTYAIIKLDQIVTRVNQVAKLGKLKLIKSFSFVMYCYLDSSLHSKSSRTKRFSAEKFFTWERLLHRLSWQCTFNKLRKREVDNHLWTEQKWFYQKMLSALYLNWAPKTKDSSLSSLSFHCLKLQTKVVTISN